MTIEPTTLEASRLAFYKPARISQDSRASWIGLAGTPGALIHKAMREVADMHHLNGEQFQRRSFKIMEGVTTLIGSGAYATAFVIGGEIALSLGAISSGLFGLAALATLALAIYGLYRIAHFRGQLQTMPPLEAVRFLLAAAGAGASGEEASRKLEELRSKTSRFAVEMIFKQGLDALDDPCKAAELVAIVSKESAKKMAVYATGALTALLGIAAALFTLLLAASPAGCVLGGVGFFINASMALLNYSYKPQLPHGHGAGPAPLEEAESSARPTSVEDAIVPSREARSPNPLPESVSLEPSRRDRPSRRLRARSVRRTRVRAVGRLRLDGGAFSSKLNAAARSSRRSANAKLAWE